MKQMQKQLEGCYISPAYEENLAIINAVIVNCCVRLRNLVWTALSSLFQLTIPKVFFSPFCKYLEKFTPLLSTLCLGKTNPIGLTDLQFLAGQIFMRYKLH